MLTLGFVLASEFQSALVFGWVFVLEFQLEFVLVFESTSVLVFE